MIAKFSLPSESCASAYVWKGESINQPFKPFSQSINQSAAIGRERHSNRGPFFNAPLKMFSSVAQTPRINIKQQVQRNYVHATHK